MNDRWVTIFCSECDSGIDGRTGVQAKLFGGWHDELTRIGKAFVCCNCGAVAKCDVTFDYPRLEKYPLLVPPEAAS